MDSKETVLCGANAYEKKYYYNNIFSNVPDNIQDELKIICVTFTEEVGGIIILKFDADGILQITTQSDEGDLLYDDIGCGLKIREIQRKKRKLFSSLELYYNMFFMK